MIALLLCRLFAILILNSCGSGVKDKNHEGNSHPFIGNPSHHGSQVQWQRVTFDTIRKFPHAIDDWHKKRELALYQVLSYSNGGMLI